MRNVMILFFCCAFYLTRAADPKYPVSAIPEELKKGMYAVIREQSTTFEIYDINKSSLTFRSVITILNSKGNKSALMGVGYDKFRTIEYFKGVAYDAAGNVIKKLKQSEIVDRSSVSGFSLFEDDRIKMADLSQMTYPYTVEFEFQVQMNFLYSIPGFWLYTDDEITTQKAVYKVVYPKLYQPRFRTFKIGDPSKKIEADGREAVTWGFENVVPVKFEKDGPDVHEIIPHILAAPDQFEYGGYRGNMSSWEEYGKWNLLLNKGRDQLPETTKQKVRELTKNLTTTEQKSKALYEYLQSKTRYVSIQ